MNRIRERIFTAQDSKFFHPDNGQTSVWRSDGESAFLARLFGIFAEDTVRIWALDEKAVYRDLGRPSVYHPDGTYTHHTFDFAFVPRGNAPRQDHAVLVGEMKAWVVHEKGKHAVLTADKAREVTDDIWGKLKGNTIKVKRLNDEPRLCAGIILVWPSAEAEDSQSWQKVHPQLKDVITLDRVLSDFGEFRSGAQFRKMLDEFSQASCSLFDGLRS